MASFWGELRRRNVVRVGIAYLAVIWVLIQVADVVLPNIGAPSWIIQALIYSSALGFPLALILAWFYEITPQGIKSAEDVGDAEAVRFTGRRIDFVIIALLVLAVGFLLVRSPDDSFAPLPSSVAVLPFENLSPDPDNAYFAAGVHEEILSHLAKLSDLSVISRTSVLRYENSDLTIPEIGRELNVETVLEGSVRFANDEVRLTMQLIDVETDGHRWAETYEREFEDIFAIESDIAMNIANALNAVLTDAAQASLERPPTESPAAYSLYLRALDEFWSGRYGRRGALDVASILSDLDQATELDPQFGLAWAFKAFLLADLASSNITNEEALAEDAANRAIELDRSLVWAHVALAKLDWYHWRYGAALTRLEDAFALNPNDPFVRGHYGVLLAETGDLTTGLRLMSQNVELDPNGDSGMRHGQGVLRQWQHDYAGSAASLREQLALAPGAANTHVQLARTEVALGNYASAIQELRIAEQLHGDAFSATDRVEFAAMYHRVDRLDEKQRLLDELSTRAEEALISPGTWAELFIAEGDYDQAREQVVSAIQSRNSEGLNRIKYNIFQDEALDEPAWVDLRSMIHSLN